MEDHGNSYVRELLHKDNYEEWSSQVKTYLLAQGLWDVVQCHVQTPERHEEAELKVWPGKNAEALHVIQRSCGDESFPLIKDISSAKIAWTTLANEYRQKTQEHSKTESEKEKETDGVVEESNSVRNEQENNSGDAPGKGSDQNGDFQRHLLLFDAVRHGNWEEAKTYLDQHPDAVRARMDVSNRTPLHIAVGAGYLHIVEELVQLMTEEDLLIQQKDGFTVLELSIQIGNIPIANCLIRKSKTLVSVVHERCGIPVAYAVLTCQFQMARYLYSVTPLEHLTLRDNGKRGSSLISCCISRHIFDIPLDLLKHCPRLAITADEYGFSPVWSLSVCSKSVFRSGCKLKFWQRWVYDCIDIAGDAANQVTIDVQNQEGSQSDKNDLTAIRSVLVGVLARMPSFLLQRLDVKVTYETKLLHVQSSELLNRMCEVIKGCSDEKQLLKDARVRDAIIEAVYNGNVEFIIKIINANPDILWTNSIAFDVFTLAIELRHADVFNLLYSLLNKQAIASLWDNNDNNMLHKAASIPSSKTLNLIPGAALQMQRQLQWFKEVETVVTPAYNEFTNKAFLRPQVLFTQNHKDLVIAGEKWMKDTSSSCTVVGALIVTITFAAAFTVPGGNNQDTGFPMFMNKKLFKVFIISDAMSLFSSTTSVLMFLGILTSRYAEEDFLKSLPKKMIIGLSTLFFSIATMMVAFCTSLSLMFREKWVGLLVSLLASVPVTLFVLMQFPLLVDIYMSTYGQNIFNRNIKPWLYGRHVTPKR